MNLQVGAHFCGGDLKSVALFGKAEPCAHASHDNEVPACHSSKKEDGDTKGCCDDEEYALEALDISTTIDHYVVQLDAGINGIVPPAIGYNEAIVDLNRTTPAYLNYKPPLIRRDIPVLIQSFLI